MDPILKLQNGSDVRGVAVEGVADEPVTLTPEYANRIVQAFVLWLSQKSGKKASELKIAVGHDSRISAPMLKQQALMAIVAQGATAVDCSMATTPAMFMSLVYEETKYDGSMMITASHLHLIEMVLNSLNQKMAVWKRKISLICSKSLVN